MKNADPNGAIVKSLHVFDGDQTHACSASYRALKDAGAAALNNPPHTTHFLQAHDAGGAFSNLQTIEYAPPLPPLCHCAMGNHSMVCA